MIIIRILDLNNRFSIPYEIKKKIKIIDDQYVEVCIGEEATPEVLKIDAIGRTYVPMGIRNRHKLNAGDHIELDVIGEKLYIKKYYGTEESVIGEERPVIIDSNKLRNLEETVLYLREQNAILSGIVRDIRKDLNEAITSKNSISAKLEQFLKEK